MIFYFLFFFFFPLCTYSHKLQILGVSALPGFFYFIYFFIYFFFASCIRLLTIVVWCLCCCYCYSCCCGMLNLVLWFTAFQVKAITTPPPPSLALLPAIWKKQKIKWKKENKWEKRHYEESIINRQVEATPKTDTKFT